MLRFLSLVSLVAVLALWSVPGCLADSTELLRGRLETRADGDRQKDTPLTFVTSEGKRIPVAGDRFSNGQLLDPRLAEREWELEGKFQSEGQFEILKLFTMRQGKRHPRDLLVRNLLHPEPRARPLYVLPGGDRASGNPGTVKELRAMRDTRIGDYLSRLNAEGCIGSARRVAPWPNY